MGQATQNELQRVKKASEPALDQDRISSLFPTGFYGIFTGFYGIFTVFLRVAQNLLFGGLWDFMGFLWEDYGIFRVFDGFFRDIPVFRRSELLKIGPLRQKARMC